VIKAAFFDGRKNLVASWPKPKGSQSALGANRIARSQDGSSLDLD
jgi:hypothetical protein